MSRTKSRQKQEKKDCFYCNRGLAKHKQTIEHILPRSLGGTDSSKNLTIACLKCNNDRGAVLSLQKNIIINEHKLKIIKFHNSLLGRILNVFFPLNLTEEMEKGLTKRNIALQFKLCDTISKLKGRQFNYLEKVNEHCRKASKK